MDAELKTRWLEALRSGKYDQTTGVLNRVKEESEDDANKQPGYCCLGVLCDVVAPDDWAEPEDADPYVRYHRSAQSTGVLCDVFLKEVGLNSRVAGNLIGRNDSGMSFEDIADYIEENV